MKIILFGMPYYNYTKSKGVALERLGHTVLMLENTETSSEAISLQKKKMIEFKPDIFINFCGNYKANIIDEEFLKKLGNCKKVTIFADAIKFVGDIEQNFKMYDRVFVFEPSDISFVKSKYGIDAFLSNANVAEEIFCKDYGDIKKEYDLSFVGLMTSDRAVFFDRIAKFAYENSLKMVCYGHFWHNNHWWQSFFAKRKFAKKYPFLVKYAKNQYVTPEEAALLYKKSRICLNKHIERHEGMNSRAFEIMANDNFMLCDERVQADMFGLLDGENIVFYKDVEDCKEKIQYFLTNAEEREKIATKGATLVRERYTTKEFMRRVIEGFDE